MADDKKLEECPELTLADMPKLKEVDGAHKYGTPENIMHPNGVLNTDVVFGNIDLNYPDAPYEGRTIGVSDVGSLKAIAQTSDDYALQLLLSQRRDLPPGGEIERLLPKEAADKARLVLDTLKERGVDVDSVPASDEVKLQSTSFTKKCSPALS